MSILKKMDLIRESNLLTISSINEGQYKILEELLEIADLIDSYYITDNDIIRVAGLAFRKGVRLAKSVYCMIIYGYAQESGALLRPLLEIIELIKYLSIDESKLTEVVSEKKPKAGQIAKAISSDFGDLRKYLNDSASHLNFDYYSLIHIIDINNNRLREEMPVDLESIESNLKTLNSFIFFLLYDYILLTHEIAKYDELIMLKMDNVREQIIK